MEQVMCTGIWSSSRKGCAATASRMRRNASSALSGTMSRSTITNSSPPQRAM
jgi:hypothetical protein